ncbi:MAG TPA: hypothetical protein VMU13_03655 [Candidatus Paceibacterota bacterium]|nr:hypothetical protein [Candidatus Paceibacterota bacterium]
MKLPRTQKGITTLVVIVFMGIFLLLLSGLAGFALEEAKYGDATVAREEALDSAEGGLEYYRWFLAHFPNNLTNGTGLPGPYSYTILDPETAGTDGTASISVVGNMQCGVIQSIDITSVGKSTLNPGFPRTLFARYMHPSVAGYSYLLNSNVWAGPSRTITGPYFSNGGIRMDGTNNSLVQSAVSTWVCNSTYGCPSSQTEPGVFGGGSGSALWQYPVASIDFAGITSGLSNLKTYAQNNGGLYFPPAGSGTANANQRGYHLIFNSNGTVDVYKVTATTAVWGYSNQYGWIQEHNIIASQTYLGNYTVPSTCSVIFVEDRVWVEGTVKGKVTVASADFVNINNTTSAFLPNNIYYATYDGTSGLTVIAAGDVLIPLNSPSTMEIHGIFVAQNGHYGRNFYTSDSTNYPTYVVPPTYNSDVQETLLTTDGTVVSNGQTGTQWTCGSPGVFCSGYATRIDSYDELQALSPPPFTPAASTNFQFVEWKELAP